jgi:hypothetical protein
VDDIIVINNGSIPPAIPDGQYDVAFRKATRAHQFGQEKLYLWFSIVTPGDWYGEELYMVCNIPRKGKYTPSTKYWLVWVFVTGKKPKRGDRMSTAVFRNKIFLAGIRTVTKTAKQLLRTREQQYSVVDELVTIQAGTPT